MFLSLCIILINLTSALSYLALPGTVGYYSFDGNANDGSGNNNHGTIVGGVSAAVDRFGNAGRAYAFDGATGYIQLPGAQFSFASDFSCSFWLKLDQLVTTGNLFVLNKAQSASGYSIYNYGSQFSLGYSTSSTVSVAFSFTPTFTLGTWNHFVMMKSGSQISFYVNGVLIRQTTTTYPAIVTNTAVPLLIGAGNPSIVGGAKKSFFKGSLDDIYVFNRALALAEITSLAGVVSSPVTITSAPTGKPSFRPTAPPTAVAV